VGWFVVVTAYHSAFGKDDEPTRTLVSRQTPIISERRVTDNSKAQGRSDSATAFLSRKDCETLVGLGNRAERQSGEVRIGTWNVRWFPDGIPGANASPTLATDVAWMACSIAWLNLEVLSLVEVKSKPRSTAALDEMVSRLAELTGETYRYRLDDCPDNNGLHLAWLWNEKKVEVRDFRMFAALNPYGDSCAKQLRPGFAAGFRFTGGLDMTAIAVHLKSGRPARDIDLRRKSMIGLGEVVRTVVHETGDADVLVLGDMNSMGCETCAGLERGAAEALSLDTLLAGYHAPMRRVPSNLGCSHYYQNQPALLDHCFVTTEFLEVPRVTKAETFGYCQSLACEAAAGTEPQAATRLSDHCPIVLSIRDEDLD
jgi:predicted extracellular nuclease